MVKAEKNYSNYVKKGDKYEFKIIYSTKYNYKKTIII